MTAAKLFCIHQFRGGKQLLKSVCNGRNIVRMNDIKSIDLNDLWGSISEDRFYGRIGMGKGALRREEREGISTVFDEYREPPVAVRRYFYCHTFLLSGVCWYASKP